MLKLLTVVGARPQFIKAAALSRSIRTKFAGKINEVIVHTGQHYDQNMSEVFFKELDLPAPYKNLDIGSGSHAAQTGRMLLKLEDSIQEVKPDAVVVYGDTNSTIAAALAASKMFIPVIHIESGLRSFNKSMPEEINRIATDHVSTLLFTPTKRGLENLKKEGMFPGNVQPFSIDNPGVFHTGDIMFDNTLFFKEKANKNSQILQKLGIQKNTYALATIHRPSNTDDQERLSGILNALYAMPSELNIKVVVSMHPRTAKKLEAYNNQDLRSKLNPENGIHLIPAVSYMDMVQLESHCQMILTDSGGVQKEAWFMEKPLIILRNETEWTEIVEHGNGILADSSTEKIQEAARKFHASPALSFPPLYGNGHAADEILDILLTNKW